MTPRIFVSSTYYDLRHVRERLEKFLDNYGFEPVLFESDKVTYEHGKPLDISAYGEVNLCHLMILIIGGRYGTASSLQNNQIDHDKYNQGYVSITRKELETALSKNMPVFIFVDRNVYSEYLTYKESQEVFDLILDKNNLKKIGENSIFKFAHVDDVNIFRFIDLIKTKAIKTFEKVEEIESYLKSQFSGLFYLYLESLKKLSENTKIIDTIGELNNISLRMNEMLSSIGKQILKENHKDEYEKVIKSQFRIMIEYFREKVMENLAFEDTIFGTLSDGNYKSITHVFFNTALNYKFKYPEKISYERSRILTKNQEDILIENLNKQFSAIDGRIKITKFNAERVIDEFHSNIEPFIQDEASKKIFMERLESTLKLLLGDLPF